MKNIFYRSLTVLVISNLLVLSSCSDGSDNPPLLTLSETEMTVQPNDYIAVSATHEKGEKKLDKIIIKGIGDEIKVHQGNESNIYYYGANIPAESGGTTIIVTFIATDNAGNETTADLTLTVETPMNRIVTNGIINNRQGPSSYNWDLVNNNSVAGSGLNSTKDIADQTSGSTGSFLNGGWSSANGTRFVVANDFDYERATLEQAISAYELGSDTTFLSSDDLEDGNIIIAKVREEDNYMAILITEVYDDGKDGGTGFNSDYRKFEYKK